MTEDAGTQTRGNVHTICRFYIFIYFIPISYFLLFFATHKKDKTRTGMPEERDQNAEVSRERY